MTPGVCRVSSVKKIGAITHKNSILVKHISKYGTEINHGRSAELYI